MPYEVKKQGGKHCVVKEGGATVACHDTKGKALAQMRALYANEKASAIPCVEDDCARSFVDVDTMLTHLDVVHEQGEAVEEARSFSTKQRKQAAQKGQARSDGSFPIKNTQDLKNAISAFGRAKNKAAAKAHIIKRAKALKATNLLPKGWLSDNAEIECTDCSRVFRDEAALFEHAEAVHTFDDIRRMVSDEVREKYNKRGDYQKTPPDPSIWAWIEDLADDWVVFVLEGDGDTTLYKASYSIMDGTVSLGEPVEVRRRTVYEPVGAKDDD